MNMLAVQMPTIICSLLLCVSAAALGVVSVSELAGYGRRMQAPLSVAALVASAASIVALVVKFQGVDRLFRMFAQIGTPLAQGLVAGFVLTIVAVVFIVLIRGGQGIARPLAMVVLALCLAAAIVAGRLIASMSHKLGERIVVVVYFVLLVIAVAYAMAWVFFAARSDLVGARACARGTGMATILMAASYVIWIAVLGSAKNASLGGYVDPTQITKGTLGTGGADAVGAVLTGELAIMFWVGAVVVGLAVALAASIACVNGGRASSKMGLGLAVATLVCLLVGSAFFQAVFVSSLSIGRVSVFN